MTKAAAKTGSGPTTMVAIEQNFPKCQRIIADDLAYRILPFNARAFVWLMRPAWARDWMVRVTDKTFSRHLGRFDVPEAILDEKLIELVGQIGAVVNLGAGFDTRAYRLPALADMRVWEVDQSENIEPKRVRLRKLFGA
jgi:methyltransferase (TIGR00027 family)